MKKKLLTDEQLKDLGFSVYKYKYDPNSDTTFWTASLCIGEQYIDLMGKSVTAEELITQILGLGIEMGERRIQSKMKEVLGL